MKTPSLYGPYHLSWLVLVAMLCLAICLCSRHDSRRRVCNMVLTITLVVTAFEIYKQINYSFTYSGGTIAFYYQWYAFPFQFCSTPMYIGLLSGIFRKGKLHDALCAYLATYAVFAGLCVMLYPGDVYCSTVGINIQTMVWHGSMILVGVYLMASGHVKLEHKTILKALPVFVVMVLMAVVMNEMAYRTGLLEEHSFNMFYISPYCDPSLPVFSLVQQAVPFSVSLVVYVTAFTLASYLILLFGMFLHKRINRCREKMAERPLRLLVQYK